MTTFGTTIPPPRPLADTTDDALVPTPEKIDNAVADGRATRSPAVDELRSQPRHSISELNDLDWDQIRERMAKTTFDNRGPVTRFLDLIDLPRNTIAGLVAPGVRRRKESEGETAALGQGRVYFSDILGEMGMRPGIVRGVLGFAGDVAMDPLTYLGGAGADIRLTTKGGQIAGELGRQGARALRGGIAELKAGQELSNPLVRDLYHEHVIPTLAHDATDAAKAEALSKAGFGEMATGLKDRLKKGDIFTRTGAGGALAESAGMPSGQGYDAAKAFMARYGMGAPVDLAAGGDALSGGVRMTPKGIAIGNAQSQIAHIPFTEFGINVPAFTSNARQNLAFRVGALTKAGAIPDITTHLNIENGLNDIGKLRDEQSQWIDRYHTAATERVENPLASQINDLRAQIHRFNQALDVDPLATGVDPAGSLKRAKGIMAGVGLPEAHTVGDFDGISHLLTNDEKAAHAFDKASELNAAIGKKADEVLAIKQGANYGNMSVSDLLHLNRKWEAAKALRDQSAAELEASPLFNKMASRISSQPAFNAIRGTRDTYNRSLLSEAEAIVGRPGLRDELSAGLEQAKAMGDQSAVDWHKAMLDQHDALIAPKIAELKANNPESYAEAIAGIADHDLQAATLHADSLHSLFRAQADFADAVGGSIAQQMNSGQRAVADYAAWLFKLDRDTLGSAPFLGASRAVRNLVGNEKEGGLRLTTGQLNRTQTLGEMDAGVRSFFGNRNSVVGQLRREAANAIQNGSPYEVAAFLNHEFSPQIRAITAKYGITDPEQVDRLLSLWTARHLQKSMTDFPTRFVTNEVRDGQLIPGSPLTRKIMETAEAGWFNNTMDPGRYKGLVDDVDKLAEASVAHMEALGEDVGNKIPGYLPNRLDPLYAREAAKKDKYGFNLAHGSSSADEAVLGAEPFQKARNSLVYQWQDKDGAWHQLWEPDFAHVSTYRQNAAPGELWNEAFKTIPEDQRANVEAMAAEVDNFNEMHPGLDPNMRHLFAKFADPWLMSEEMNKRFSAVTGGSPIADKMMDDNMLRLLMARQREQYAYKAKQALSDFVLKDAMNLNERVAAASDRAGIGKEVTFQNGVRGMTLRGKNGKPTVKVGDVLYRPIDIDPAELKQPNMMSGLLDERHLAQYVPTEKAEIIERMFAAGKGDNISQIGRLADFYTSMWKSLTLSHPSWISFNLAGLAWQAMAGRIPVDSFIKHARDAFEVIKHKGNLDRLGRDVELAGQKKSLADIAIESDAGWGGGTRPEELMTQNKGTFESRYGENIIPGPDTVAGRVQQAAGNLRNTVSNWRSDYARRMDLYARQFAVDHAPTAWEKMKVGAQQFYDEGYMRRFFKPFFKLNSFMEDWFRTTAYMAMLDKGTNPEAAKRFVKDTFYDFGDFTRGEQKARRLIPFYSWMRNNGAWQLNHFLQDPKMAAMAPKFKEAVEEAIAGDQQIPEHERPQWWREQLAVQLGGDPDERTALMVGTAINPEPLYQVGGALTGMDGVMNLIRWFTAGINPAITVPQQLGAGRETFTGREIGAHEGEGDMSASEFLLGQARPIRELVPIGPRKPGLIKEFSKGPVQGTERLLFGGRAQPADEGRRVAAVQRETDEKANNLRKFITISEREGDSEASVRARVRLLSLYQDAQRRGAKVPAWARKQLATTG